MALPIQPIDQALYNLMLSPLLGPTHGAAIHLIGGSDAPAPAAFKVGGGDEIITISDFNEKEIKTFESAGGATDVRKLAAGAYVWRRRDGGRARRS